LAIPFLSNGKQVERKRSVLCVVQKNNTMQHLPTYVYLTFGATAIFAMKLFYKATNKSKTFLIGLSAWIIIQSVLAIAGFYSNPNTMATRFPLLILPPMLFLISRFAIKKGRAFLDGLNLPMLTIFHVIRIPVEFVLFWLFVNNSIPEAMTFHGRFCKKEIRQSIPYCLEFDLPGLTAQRSICCSTFFTAKVCPFRF
jgi:hypothetical protein